MTWSSRRGIVAALASATLFGISTPFAKIMLGEVSPWMLAGLLYLGSGVGLALFRLVRRSPEAGLSPSDAPWLTAAIVAGGIVAPVLLMFGLRAIAAATAALLLNLEAVFTLALAWFAFRENVDLRIGLGAAAIVAGAFLLSWEGGGFDGGWGALLIAGACLAWAIDNNLTRRVSAADPVQIAMLKGCVAGVINIGLAAAIGAGWPSMAAAGAAGLIGFLGYGVSLALFVLALRDLGTARTGAYFSLAPAIGAVLAIALLDEPVTASFMVAAVLIGAGLWLHVTERHEHEHVHEPMVHQHRHVHDEHHRHDHSPGTPTEPHTHLHAHARLVHRHPHYPDIHHRHPH